jgi:hypothetical protein
VGAFARASASDTLQPAAERAACGSDAASALTAAAWARFDGVCRSLARGGPADAAAFLQLWFRGLPMESIAREDVRDLLAYCMWYSDGCGAAPPPRAAPQPPCPPEVPSRGRHA